MELDSSQHAAQRQFDSRSKHYGASHILANTEDVEQSLPGIDLNAKKALDVATGAGHTGLFLARRGMDVTFSDISSGMLERVKETLHAEGLSGEIHQHTAEKLPYPDASFDLVTSRVAPHHFSDPQGFVRESARVLKTGGHLLIIDAVSPDDDEEAAEWINRVEKLRDPSHVRLYKLSEWHSWMNQSGLEVVFTKFQPLKQIDLEWYFDVAATTPENQKEVHSLIKAIPENTRKIIDLREEDGKIVWWWQRMRLLAQKTG